MTEHAGDADQAGDADREPATAPVGSPEPEPETPRDASPPDQSPVVLSTDVPPPISPSDTPTVAARKVMWTHVARLLDRDLEIREPDKPDALRKYRVATRRLRSALRVFAFALPDGQTERLRRELGELAEAVGAVRDADVRIANALDFGASSDRDPALLEPLIEDWRAERAHGYARLMRRVETKQHRRFLERLARFVEDRPATATMAGGKPPGTVRRRAAAHVWDAYERVRGYGEVIRWADIATLHQLRTETKRARYTVEFLVDILGPDSGWLTLRLTALQDHLGAINDAAVTAGAVRAFLEHRGGALAAGERAAIVAYLTDREREVNRLRRSIGRAWRPVASVTFARRLGRTVVIA